MIPPSSADIRATYPDLLDGTEDDDLEGIVQTLHSGYSLGMAPAGLRNNAPIRRPADVRRSLDGARDRYSLLLGGEVMKRRARFSASRLRWIHLPVAAFVLLSLTVGVVLAVSAITNLGPPSDALPSAPAPVLDGFARRGPVLKHAGKPEVLFIGTQVSGAASGTAVELWAMVKALDQFGHFSGVGMAETQQCEGTTVQTARCFPPNNFSRGYAILNLDHARYSSRYLTFAHKDLIDLGLHVHTNFTSVESSLIQTYIRRYVITLSSAWADFAWQESNQPPEHLGLPLVSIGGYLRVDSGVAISGDLIPTMSNIPLSFSAVQDSLRRGKAVEGAPYSLVPNINAEANVLTALMCHADGKRPGSVCNRTVVKKVLKHLK